MLSREITARGVTLGPAIVRDLMTRAALVSVVIVLMFQSAFAVTDMYEIRGTTDTSIYHLNLTTNVLTTILTGYPGGSSATIAQRSSDGMLFYAINATDGQVYRFNPATPNIAPVALTSTLGAGVPASFRMAFSPGGTLYYLPDSGVLYTINQTTGVATAGPTITGLGSGGDMAFSAGGTLYVVNSSRQLFTAPLGGGAATTVGTITFGASTPATLGLGFDGSGTLRVQTQNPSSLYTVPLPSLVAASPVALGGGTTSTGDLASADVPQPNLSITKTDGVSTVYRGGPVNYTIVVSNLGTYAVTGTVTDTVPASVTGVAWTCVASGGSSCTAASGAGNAINTSATLAAGGTATYTVSGTLSAAASGTLANTVTVAVPAWLTDSNPANNTATDTDTINLNANLGITKTDGLANINSGSPVTYTIVVSNAGPDASNGSIVTDTVPASITGVNWTCGAATGGATCGAASGSGNSISTTANLPSGSSVTYTVSGTLSPAATGTLSNTATVITPASGVSDPTDLARTGAGNNSATDTTTINAVPDLRIAKTHSGNFTVGVNGTYTLTASNAGSANTSGTITVVDNLPAGLTVAALPTGTGWNCSTTVIGSNTATCTSSTVINAGTTSPNPITVTVVVAPAAFPSVTNSATISGGNEPASNNGNNSVTDPTTVNGVADVQIAKSHSGNFTVGVNGTYTLTASNSGTLATSGTITVVDNLPAGLTIAALPTGTGWNCSTTVIGSNTATCTSSTVIAAGATSPNPITVTVVVAPAAFPSVTNSATISGGGEPAYNNSNNSVTDPTTVNGVPDLTIAKTHVGNFTQGQVGATYSITATNSGTAATSGTVTVVDTLPAGLTATAISGTGWACVLGTLTCTRSDALAAGASYPVITLTVTVANNAPASVTNSVSVSGGGQTNTSNDSANDVTTINQLPDLTITKSHVGNFTQGQVGATYSITATNSGFAATSGTVTVVDTLPAGLTATAISGTGWACVLGTLTCTRSDALAAGSSYPVITLTVNVANNAAASVTNSASVSGGGQTNTANDSASDPTTINQLPDLTITKSHVGNFTQGQVGATYSITATNSGFAATSGTVTVVDTLPAGLTATAISGASWACVLGTLTCTRSDALAAGASYPVITLTVTVANNTPASVTNSVSVSGGGQTNTSNDSANDVTTINQLPDLTITKSHVGNFTQGQVGATYSITTTNSGFAPTSGTVTVVDTLPAGLTATAISGTGWACVLGTLTCTRSDALAAGSSYPVITLTVTVANNAPASVTNSVSVSGGGQTNTTNDTATNPTTINQLPDLTIAKTHVGNFTQGQVGATYSITATNSGFAATSGTVTVTDTLPAGLTATAISGSGWSCVLGTLTCTRSDSLAAGSSYPVITLTVTVANNAPASVTNSVSVSGGGQTNTTNDTATNPTTINQLPDLTITKSHTGNFTQGQVGATYSITATNSGFAPTSGTVTVTDTLPAGLTATAISGTGWSCVLGTLTCTRSDALAAGSSYPVITLTVTVANNAPASVTNSASVSGGGQTNTGNDTANDPTTINQLPDLTITKTHVGNFTQGQVGATYSITAANSGSAATSGTVTVTDTLPAGLTATAISGTGWACVLGTLTCTRSDALAAGASYPVITLTVTVANNAPASVTNSVSVSGGGQTNTGNDTANDPTTINQLPDLTITKTHVGNFTQGQVGATYSITATNSGFAATSGTVTVTDTLPAGLTATAISGTGWVCVLGTLTCTRSDALAPSISYPVITLTVDVSLTAPASVTNSATVSGGGENNATNNTANDLTTINAAAPPSIGLVKSVSPSGTQSPGTDLVYTIAYTNTGGQPGNNFIIVDPNPANAIPAERVFRNVDFKVGSLTSSPGSSGLVASFQYSNDGGATWTYTPVSGGGGAPAGYDRAVTNVRWSFAGSLSQTAPNNTGSVSFTVRIR